MKAARLYGPRDLRIDDVPMREPQPGEAPIKIRACGVCPSDIRAWLGVRTMALPLTPGHEWAGDTGHDRRRLRPDLNAAGAQVDGAHRLSGPSGK